MHKEKTLMILRQAKTLAVKQQSYEFASEIRAVERRVLAGETISEEELDGIIQKGLEKGMKYESDLDRIGEHYSLDEQSCKEIDELLSKASSRRLEASLLLEDATLFQRAAFEIAYKANAEIPKEMRLSYNKETKAIIIIGTQS